MLRGFTELDLSVIDDHGLAVAGIDEVGMGPLAGPVCACALMLDMEKALRNMSFLFADDSKALSREQREKLFPLITDASIYGVGWTQIEEINRFQSVQTAGDLARERALRDLMQKATVKAVIIDFFDIKTSVPCVSVPRADSKSFLVACASIVAKCIRDWHMIEQHKKFPVYHWHTNMGYRSRDHWKGIWAHGESPLHRHYLVRRYKRDNWLGAKKRKSWLKGGKTAIQAREENINEEE